MAIDLKYAYVPGNEIFLFQNVLSFNVWLEKQLFYPVGATAFMRRRTMRSLIIIIFNIPLCM
jgi:hypothetical protein